ncbi:MAG: hypothetical protein RL173_615 [Fibrobacterota bacterium]
MTRIELDPFQREKLSRAAESFFVEQWDEPVSDLRRRIFLDWLENEAGYLFYNRGIQDAIVSSQMAQAKLQDDLDLLRKMA